MDIEIDYTHLANLLKVLAEPNRLKIIKLLADADHELTCGQISTQLAVSNSTVSYHFKAMRQAGLTKTRVQGNTKFLSLNQATFQKYLPNFLALLK